MKNFRFSSEKLFPADKQPTTAEKKLSWLRTRQQTEVLIETLDISGANHISIDPRDGKQKIPLIIGSKAEQKLIYERQAVKISSHKTDNAAKATKALAHKVKN